MSLSILDNSGQLIKTYAGDALGTEVGLNQMIWDMSYPDVVGVPGKPRPGVVVQASPGSYQAKLTVDGESQVQSFELHMNPNETWTQDDADARFELWWRLRTITENANNAVIEALEMAEAAGADSELAARAQAFSATLLPVGSTLSEIANEPAKLLSKLSSVNWMLVQSEGRPPQSAYDVVDAIGGKIDTEIAAWNEYKASAGR